MIGSTWNKWDLHLHSPLTHQANQFGEVNIDEFVDVIITSNLKLTGITNYFFFKENELEIIRDKIKEKGVEHTILGKVRISRSFLPKLAR
ncbi:hypothetical protein [Aeromonas salmonicida]|uniref:hypothetical protein n=1 Tax=Aeromonas salmonicida TaxID=645 RepID=UPI0038CFBC9F